MYFCIKIVHFYTKKLYLYIQRNSNRESFGYQIWQKSVILVSIASILSWIHHDSRKYCNFRAKLFHFRSNFIIIGLKSMHFHQKSLPISEQICAQMLFSAQNSPFQMKNQIFQIKFQFSRSKYFYSKIQIEVTRLDVILYPIYPNVGFGQSGLSHVGLMFYLTVFLFA